MPSGCARIRTSSIFITTFRPHESGYVECAPRISAGFGLPSERE